MHRIRDALDHETLLMHRIRDALDHETFLMHRHWRIFSHGKL
jgi:hypothetical protein